MERYKKEIPPSSLHDISEQLGNHSNSFISCIKSKESYSNGDDEESEGKYSYKVKALAKAYKNVSSAPFVKALIKYLKELYTVKNLMEKMDANPNLLAFDNKVFDLELGQMRPIKPSDFISKTTKYEIKMRRDEQMAEKIRKLLWNIWENKKVIEYWLISTALSMFGKSVPFHQHWIRP